MTINNRLPKLPSMPRLRAQNRCACGCNGLTGSRFVPGHDATLKGMRIRVERSVWNPEAVGDAMAQLKALAIAMSEGQADATALEMGLATEWALFNQEVEIEQAA